MPKPSDVPVRQAPPPKRPVVIPFSEAFWDFAAKHYGFTKCERSTVQLLMATLSDKQIAARRRTGIDIVKKHLGRAARKMNVHGRLQIFGAIYKLFHDYWHETAAALPEYAI